jgi:hypothetical protein
MKKFIVAASLLLSFSVLANEEKSNPSISSVDSFISVLPLGTHLGVNELGARCSVVVSEVNFPEKAINVSVLKGNHKIFKTINEGSEFFFRSGRREFIQSERFYVDDTRTSYVDRIVRTVLAGDNKLFVVVANEITVNRERFVEALECIVNF